MSTPKKKKRKRKKLASDGVRQKAYRDRQVAAGNCCACGQPRNLYAHYCDECARKSRERHRKVAGCEPWQPGKRGRPPKVREPTTPGE